MPWRETYSLLLVLPSGFEVKWVKTFWQVIALGTLFQDPRDAEHPLSEVGPLLVRLANDPAEGESVRSSEKVEIESRIALNDPNGWASSHH